MKALHTLSLAALAILLTLGPGCSKSEPPPEEGEEKPTYAGNLLGGLDKTAVNRTRGDMEAIGKSLEVYATSADGYPEAADIAALEAVLTPNFLRLVPSRDQWGNPLLVESSASGYKVTALCKDGKLGTDDDIVMVTGAVFTHLPKGF